MSVLGTIRGSGILVTRGEEEPVGYSVTVTQSGGWKEGNGSISGSPRGIMAAFNADQSTLRLEDGSEIIVLITQIGIPGGEAQIKVSGPIPGF